MAKRTAAAVFLMLASGQPAIAGTGGKASERAPACMPQLVQLEPSRWLNREMQIKVGQREVPLGKPVSFPQALVVYPAGPDAVFLAYQGRNEHGPYGGDKLWRLTCKDPHADVFTHIPGADFGHSAIAADGRTLMFTGADGIFALDLETKKAQRVTQAPALATCDTNNTPHASDVVDRFIDRSTLRFQRGGPCGFEAEWQATDMLVRRPGTTAAKVEEVPHPFASVAIDAGGGFWLADGRCEDSSTNDRVLFSNDHGEHWRTVPVKTRGEQPIRQIITDKKEAGSVLFFSFACGSSAHMDPGWVYVSADAGRTIRPIAVPAGINKDENDGPASEEDPLQGIAAPEGDINHLILYGTSESVPGDRIARWESRDGGRSWTSIPPVNAVPGMSAKKASLGEWTLTIQKDGLYRSRNGAPAIRIYPRI